MTSTSALDCHGTSVRLAEPGCDPELLPTIYINWIFGDCCEPIVFHGEGVVVSKVERVQHGDLVAIMARTPGERAGLTSGFVKRFVGWHRDAAGVETLVTEQLKPRRVRVFPAEQVLAVHKVVNVISIDPGLSSPVERLEKMSSVASTFGRRPSASSITRRVLPGLDPDAGNSSADAGLVRQVKT